MGKYERRFLLKLLQNFRNKSKIMAFIKIYRYREIQLDLCGVEGINQNLEDILYDENINKRIVLTTI